MNDSNTNDVLYEYYLGLQMGGLMECTEWHIVQICTIQAKNLRDAKAEWAKITGEDKLTTWDKEYQTVWGWSIKLTSTNDPNVAKEDYFLS